MTDPDRLAEIKARWANKPEALEVSKAWALVDVRWLVAEVEQTRQAAATAANLADERGRELARLWQGDEFSRMHAEMVGLHKGFEVKEAEVEQLRELADERGRELARLWENLKAAWDDLEAAGLHPRNTNEPPTRGG